MDQRFAEQIVGRGIKNPRVIEAMTRVKRELFVPEASLESAYGDHPLEIGHGQTISQPFIVASMTELAAPLPTDIVLEVGTGSGYQTAVLAELVKSVFSIERIAELATRAEARLIQLGYQNIKIKVGNGYLGWPEAAPFDKILVTAAPEKIPDSLIAQLKPGGLMVIPVGPTYDVQILKTLMKQENGKIVVNSEYPVRFVPLKDEEN